MTASFFAPIFFALAGVNADVTELYRQLDLADAVVERAHKVPAVNLWARGDRREKGPRII